jgi:hypothetical protein
MKRRLRALSWSNQEPEEGEEEEEGEGPSDGFDYDAHIARLLEASERSLGWAPPRGWEDDEMEKVR